MDILGWFKEYLTSGGSEDGCAVAAASALYRATGDEAWRRFVLDAAERGAADALFFALEETGEERWRTAIEERMHHLRRAAGPLDGKALYAAGPFLMAYEMKFGGMEKVAEVVRLFRQAHEVDAAPDPWRLLALADTIALCREELYEHYRALVDLFRAELAAILQSPAADALTVCAMMKAVRLGLIDPEKYLPIARKIFAALQENPPGGSGAGAFVLAWCERS